jgi:small subunit ribosomal protein S18
MSRFNRFGTQPKVKVVKEGPGEKEYVDYKDVENLRRLLSPNGKIYARKRVQSSAKEQRMIAQAIKRARFLGLLPYTSATL